MNRTGMFRTLVVLYLTSFIACFVSYHHTIIPPQAKAYAQLLEDLFFNPWDPFPQLSFPWRVSSSCLLAQSLSCLAIDQAFICSLLGASSCVSAFSSIRIRTFTRFFSRPPPRRFTARPASCGAASRRLFYGTRVTYSEPDPASVQIGQLSARSGVLPRQASKQSIRT